MLEAKNSLDNRMLKVDLLPQTQARSSKKPKNKSLDPYEDGPQRMMLQDSWNKNFTDITAITRQGAQQKFIKKLVKKETAEGKQEKGAQN